MRNAVIIAASLIGVSGVSTLPAYSAPVIVQGYYEDQINRSCSNVTSCASNFTTVPAGKLLVVKFIACRIPAGGSSPLIQVQFSAAFRHTFLKPVQIASTASNRYFIINEEMTKIVEAGATPSITVSFAGATNWSQYCLLSGQITP